MLSICLIGFLSACSNQNINKVEPTNDMEPKELENTIQMKNQTIPNGIYYDGQIYWDIDYEKTNNLPNAQLGFLQECSYKIPKMFFNLILNRNADYQYKH